MHNRSGTRATAVSLAGLLTLLSHTDDANADAIYFKQRTINRIAQPVCHESLKARSYTCWPEWQKTREYHNQVNLPVCSDLRAKYPNVSITCPTEGHFVHDAIGPDAKVTGLLSPRPLTTVKGKKWRRYMNLLYTGSEPGFVYLDPSSSRYVQFAYLGKHYHDNPSVSQSAAVFNDLKIYYRLSEDDGLSFQDGSWFKPLIVGGPASRYSAVHPLEGVDVNRNGATISGLSHLTTDHDGHLLLPVAITIPEESSNVTTFTNAYVLRGKWKVTGSLRDYEWIQSAAARLTANLSTRGADEPTVLDLNHDDRCVMIARGSNQTRGSKPTVAGHHWVFESDDVCKTWKGPSPKRLAFSDGTQFYAPAANSILYRSPRNARIYWVGHISASNSNGNWPRTKFIIAEFDPVSLGIVKDSATIIDQMEPGLDGPEMQIFNSQVAIQDELTAFIFWKRKACNNCAGESTSWIDADITTGSHVKLSATAGTSGTHHLQWHSTTTGVKYWHVRRRYLSGDPLSFLWQVIGTEKSADQRDITLTGYLPWQEAEYEIVAEQEDGTAEVSNRVTVRFPEWNDKPRLSFGFATEATAGAPSPSDSILLTWSYEPQDELTNFKVWRRYFSNSGGAGTWHLVDAVPASHRSMIMAGYRSTQRFELRVDAHEADGIVRQGNPVYVRFPAPGDTRRLPY